VPPSLPPPGPQLSGAILLEQIAYANERFGMEAYQRALATLKPKDREVIESLLAVSWLAPRIAEELKNAMARELRVDPIDFQKELCRAGVERAIHKFWRGLLAMMPDPLITSRSPILYRRVFSPGDFQVAMQGPGTCTWALTGWPDIVDYDAIGIQAGLEAILTYTGRKHVRGRFERSGPQVLFHASWRT
jgi:hypothetical protein